MSDEFTVLSPGSGGDNIDMEGVQYGTNPVLRKRSRVIVGGSNPTALAPVLNVKPDSNNYGLPVRHVPIPRSAIVDNCVACSTTTATPILTGITDIYLDLIKVLVTNTSIQGVRVDILDGNTLRLSVFAAAGGGGAVVDFSESAPLPQRSTNTDWSVVLSDPTLDVRVTLVAIKSTV